MQHQQFRIGRIDQDGAEYISDDVLDAFDATGILALEHVLLSIGGWQVDRCGCGGSIRATKGDLVRTVVAIPVEDVESLALAVGLLAPASHVGGLVGV